MRWMPTPEAPPESELYPHGAVGDLPPIPAPSSKRIADLEATARVYAAAHADAHGIRPAYLARVTFDTLVAAGRPRPTDGRWPSAPPPPGYYEARNRLDPMPSR